VSKPGRIIQATAAPGETRSYCEPIVCSIVDTTLDERELLTGLALAGPEELAEAGRRVRLTIAAAQAEIDRIRAELADLERRFGDANMNGH
jgi:hypothetical protein